jgi:uncharacterized protein YoxC
MFIVSFIRRLDECSVTGSSFLRTAALLGLLALALSFTPSIQASPPRQAAGGCHPGSVKTLVTPVKSYALDARGIVRVGPPSTGPHSHTGAFSAGMVRTMAQQNKQQKDLLSRLSGVGEDAISRVAGSQTTTRLMESVGGMRERLDDVQKKVRGLDALEKRVAKLEKRVAELSKPKRATTSRSRTTAAKKTTASTRKKPAS